MRRALPWLLMVTACGGASTPAARTSNGSQEASRADEECSTERGDDCVLLVGSLAHPADTRPAPRPPSSTVTLPAARRDRTRTANDVTLSAAESAYARLAATPTGVDAPSADAATGVQTIVAQIQSMAGSARQVTDACAPLERAPGPARVAALTLHADALDFVASRTAGMTMPMPLDLERTLASASPEVVAEMRAQFTTRLSQLFGEQARAVYCQAVGFYQQALAFDPGATRAAEQLALYGGAFLRTCPP